MALQKNNDIKWKAYSELMKPSLMKKRIPYSGTFELTPLCNLKCNMCYVRLSTKQVEKTGGLLSAEQWIELGSQVKKAGTLYLEITGGEVFTRSDFQYIYESLYDMGFFIVLRTNAYAINPSILEWLKKRKPYMICVTLYGASDDTYNRICDVKDGYTRVSRNILALKETGIPLRVSMTVTNDNVDDYKNVYYWTKSNNVIFAGGYSGLFKPRAETARGDVSNKRVVKDYDGIDESDFTEMDDLSEDDTEDYSIARTSPFFNCKSYGIIYSVSWNGKLTVCNTMSSFYENLKKQSFQQAYNNLYDRMDQLRRPQECLNCKYIRYCSNCPAKLDAETGNPEVMSKEICKRTKEKYRILVATNKKRKNDIDTRE